jgi:hypothetical protein
VQIGIGSPAGIVIRAAPGQAREPRGHPRRRPGKPRGFKFRPGHLG